MKLYAPKYYEKFNCIADKCRHSCCVGWEIDIDEDTARKYAALTNDYGKEIEKSIDRDEIPHFRLCEGERCPHLAPSGLCRIICELGEGFLCDICREHPRFYNDTSRGKEVGLGMACEEACRIILSSDEYKDLIEIGEVTGEEQLFDFDAIQHREKIFSLLSEDAMPYPARIERISSEYGVSLSTRSDDGWGALICSLEYLNEAHKEMFLRYSSEHQPPKKFEKMLERAFAYFVFRHCSGAESEANFLSALGLALFCERLLSSLSKSAENENEVTGLARIISEEIEYSEDNTEAIKAEFE